MTGESSSYMPRSNENRRPAAKRRKIRKGTTSCWELPESVEGDKTNGLEGRLERVEALLQRLLDGGVCLSTPRFSHRTADTIPPSLRITKEDDGDVFDAISRTLARGHRHNDIQPSHHQMGSDNPRFPHIHRLPPTTPNNYELISRELYSALPSQHDADLIIAAGNTAPFLQFLCRPYEDLFRGKMLPASVLSTFPSPKSHPVLIARSLLYLAHGIQNLHPPTFDLGQLDLGSSPAAAMQRFLDMACRLVTSNDELMESLEGVECLVLEFAYHINAGNLRRAWLVMRRAISLAQLLGLHQGDYSDLTILEPMTMASPSFTWHRIVSQDRYLALMLGLPAGTPDDCLGNPQDLAPDDCPMGYLERIHCIIMGRITASRRENTNDENPVELRSIDSALENAARGMPSDRWLFPSTKRGSPGQDEDLEEEETHDSSKSACVNASRELLRRYIRFRCMDSIAFCCTSIDFSAFTACLTLLLAHLRRWHHNLGVTDGIAHQRLSDRDMVHETVELMHELSQECGDAVLGKTAEIVTSLARIEADAAKQSGLYGDYGSTNHRLPPNRSLRLMIPSFGVLSGPLVEHGQESATEVPFFSFGAGNANGPQEMQTHTYLHSLGAPEEHALWNDEGPNARLETWEFCGTNSRNLSFSLDAGLGEWAHQTDMPGPDCSDEQDELFSSFLNNLAT
ncbi:C6 zinc finger domain-containing [Fusarium albosuccineum]|uniref:C6 zinc finger domain-containing n=1 Tax=Fusarium albosuccineum TaxID=1237068 RepID=A0A8H4LKN2_9HYPO|nr:C6 zinc finger domain-containing [Fusarium albosuccineum]